MEIKRHYRPEKVKKYAARWYVEKRLKCRFFATEAEREQFIEKFQEQLSQNGTSLLLGFDPAKMRRWQETPRLAPDADPVEVMRFWLASNRPNLTPKPFGEAIPAYLKYLEAMERQPAYRKHVEAHLRDFADNMAAEHVHEVTHQMIAKYILGMPYKPVTKRHYKRSIGGAYAWWIEQGWAMDNPAKKVRTPEVITPEQSRWTLAKPSMPRHSNPACSHPMLSSPPTQKRHCRRLNLTTRLRHEARITHVDFVRTYWVPNRSGWAHDSYRITGDRGSTSANREMGKAGQCLLSRTSTA